MKPNKKQPLGQKPHPDKKYLFKPIAEKPYVISSYKSYRTTLDIRQAKGESDACGFDEKKGGFLYKYRKHVPQAKTSVKFDLSKEKDEDGKFRYRIYAYPTNESDARAYCAENRMDAADYDEALKKTELLALAYLSEAIHKEALRLNGIDKELMKHINNLMESNHEPLQEEPTWDIH